MVRRVKTLFEKFEASQPYQKSFYHTQDYNKISRFPGSVREKYKIKKSLSEPQARINFIDEKLKKLRKTPEISEDDFSEEDFGFSKIENRKFEKGLGENNLIGCENGKKYFSEIRTMRKTRNILTNKVNQPNLKLKNIFSTRLSGGRDPGLSSPTISSISEVQLKNKIPWNDVKNKKTEIEISNTRKRKLDPEFKYRKPIIPKYKSGLPSKYLEKEHLRVSVSKIDQKILKQRKEFSKSTPIRRNHSEMLKSISKLTALLLYLHFLLSCFLSFSRSHHYGEIFGRCDAR
ncbi:uncharacterized protein LOC117173148 isoform X2 [Belonocnema kinseyi]|uniref:uncharacterized protein LOC117173148 isoform X2 n=1 Tax=Belonocnema kinseyi TaxID=2817044 RepID=UPI00143CC4C0|nr:uncharacterized protein LOC117173148 isoform X2 [Belonocnema kinseyi]